MAIASAIQQGGWVKAYDEQNRCIFNKFANLQSFSGESLEVVEGRWLKIYDHHGHCVDTQLAQ